MEQLKKEFAQIPELYTDEQIETESVMVPMSDGVCLKTWIVRPKVENTLPTLFQRSCYPTAFDRHIFIAREFAKRGFGCVLQYCRGTGGSEGEWEPNVYERPDGIDSICWLNEQEWVESIGFYGASYLALTGWAFADCIPEKVKGMYLSVYGTNRYVSAYKDGLFRQDILTAWAMGNAGCEIHADYEESCKFMPHNQVDVKLWGVSLPWYRELISHTDFEDEYWQSGFWETLRQIPSRLQIPVVIEEGWYDHHLGSALDGYRSMRREQQENCLLRIGAWKHGSEPALTGHIVNNLRNEQILPVYRFFDTLLRKKEKTETGVQLYLIGEDRWIQLEQLPDLRQMTDLEQQRNLNQASAQNHEEKSSNEYKICQYHFNCASNTLDTPSVSQENVRTYIYDPENPVYSHGAESCLQTMKANGSLKQPEMNSRPDMLSFISEPLEENVTVIGKIEADIYVSSDAEDTAFSMKVMEVFENGEAYNVRSGITTLAYRGHSASRQIYTPNEIVKVNIDTWDIAWTFRKGSRIRVDISSSDFPQYSIHTNYPGVWSKQEKCKCAEQKVYGGGRYDSVLRLPVWKEKISQ